MTEPDRDTLDGNILWIGLGAAVALMVTGAASGRVTLAITGGVLFTATILAVGAVMAWAAGRRGDREATTLDFARLIAAGWAWCGVAMLASYYLTALAWQHAWQYGAAMVLIGGGILAYARAREQPGSRLSAPANAVLMRWLTALQGAAALAGVVILSLSGKVEAFGRDWAANVVFIAGGIAIAGLSAMALVAEYRARP